MNRLEAGVAETMDRWAGEAEMCAARAMKAGRKAVLVEYPTGLLMMRFAEPFTDFGMHYEVPPEVWARLKSNGGKVYC